MNYSVCNEINQAHAYKVPTQRTLYLFLSKFISLCMLRRLLQIIIKKHIFKFHKIIKYN